MARRPSQIPYMAAALITLLLVVAAWVGRDRFTPVGPGSMAPQYEATTLTGEPVTIEDFRGKVVLLNIWATWCAPCRYEMPSMERLYQEFQGHDFEIVAVSIDAPAGLRDPGGNPGGNIQAFADSLGLTFPLLHDPSGGIQRAYQTTGVPESFLLARDGTIFRKVAGATEWDAPHYVELIHRLLEG